MKIYLSRKNVLVVLLTIIITLVITLVILICSGLILYKVLLNKTINMLSNTVGEMCANESVSYRGDIILPAQNGIYQKDLATILWDIGGAAGTANCKKSIPSPPFFTDQFPLLGTDIDTKRDTMYGFIFYTKGYMINANSGQTANIAIFAFSGTFHSSQWDDNLKFDLVKAKNLNGYIDNSSNNQNSNGRTGIPEFIYENQSVKIHKGFYEIYSSIRNQLWSWWNSNKSQVDYLFVTGRSLGGALSTVCAFDFAGELPQTNLIHYTFAAPRVGNITFADIFNERVPYSVRVFNTEDLVCNLPPVIWKGNAYKHTSNNLKPFTKNTGSVVDNHIGAYRELPT